MASPSTGDPAGAPIFYHNAGSGAVLKIVKDHIYGMTAVAVGDQIVVCYALEDDASKLFFRVIDKGRPGPVSSIPLSKPGKDPPLAGQVGFFLDRKGGLQLVYNESPDILYELEMVSE